MNKLSANYLIKNDFKLNIDKPFEDIHMNYYARDGILLFFNEPVTQWNENSFYIGHGDMRNGKYYATFFRWIDKEEDLIQIYETITNKNYKNYKNV